MYRLRLCLLATVCLFLFIATSKPSFANWETTGRPYPTHAAAVSDPLNWCGTSGTCVNAGVTSIPLVAQGCGNPSVCNSTTLWINIYSCYESLCSFTSSQLIPTSCTGGTVADITASSGCTVPNAVQ